MTAFHLPGAAPYSDGGLFSWLRGTRAARWQAPSRPGLLRRSASACLARLRERVRRRRLMAELGRLTDRELVDIGLSRSEIGLIYSPEFAARRNAERLG